MMIEPRDLFNFCKVENSIESYAITIDETLPYFVGHFPENPILPGIAIIDASLLLVHKHLGHSLLLKAIKSAKFTGLIKPSNKLIVSLAKKNDAHSVTWFNGPEEKVAEIEFIF
jgi:3-hydroxymyristoyl/3-hydroxydecanoyl-(acyl carrier protein) dehydratase